MKGHRVALVLATSSGGVGNHVRSLSADLASRGCTVAVVGPPETEERFGFTAGGARFAPVGIGGEPRPARDAAALARLRGLLAGADVVHAHGIRAGAMCALSGASPLVVTVHNAAPRVGGPRGLVFPVLERIVARRADVVLGVSADLVRRLSRRGARDSRLAVVAAPPMPPARRGRDDVRAELGVPPESPLLLVVARLAAQKGLQVLLDAVPEIADRVPEPFVAVAGDGPLRGELGARAAAEGLPVHLLGHRSDIPDLLAAADVFLLPSFWEGPSLVIMEALRAGLPVVASRVGGIPDLYTGVARLVPPRDAGALAREVVHVLDDPELAKRMRARAKRAAETLPTEDDTLAQLLRVYGPLVERSEGHLG